MKIEDQQYVFINSQRKAKDEGLNCWELKASTTSLTSFTSVMLVEIHEDWETACNNVENSN